MRDGKLIWCERCQATVTFPCVACRARDWIKKGGVLAPEVDDDAESKPAGDVNAEHIVAAMPVGEWLCAHRIAELAGVHLDTARKSLRQLHSQGVLERTHEPPGMRRRPRWMYRRTS